MYFCLSFTIIILISNVFFLLLFLPALPIFNPFLFWFLCLDLATSKKILSRLWFCPFKGNSMNYFETFWNEGLILRRLKLKNRSLFFGFLRKVEYCFAEMLYVCPSCHSAIKYMQHAMNFCYSFFLVFYVVIFSYFRLDTHSTHSFMGTSGKNNQNPMRGFW